MGLEPTTLSGSWLAPSLLANSVTIQSGERRDSNPRPLRAHRFQDGLLDQPDLFRLYTRDACYRYTIKPNQPKLSLGPFSKPLRSKPVSVALPGFEPRLRPYHTCKQAAEDLNPICRVWNPA